MSIQTEINARTAKLQAILADANESIAAKNGTEAVDLKSLPEAIDGIPAGDVNLQVKAVTPTGKIITVRPDSGYDGLSAVNVAGDAYLVPENIADGVTIYGVTGTLEAEVPVMQYKSVTPTGEYITVEPDSGYDGLGAVIVEGDGALVPENIVKDVTIYGVTGTHECESEGGGGNAIPEPYATYIAEAEEVYNGYAIYNGEELPNIDSVWTDRSTYPYAVIGQIFNKTALAISSTPLVFWENDDEMGVSNSVAGSLSLYTLEGNSWSLYASVDSLPAFYNFVYPVSWCSYDVLIYGENAVYLAASDPVALDSYTDVIYAEGYGEDTGVMYHTVMFLLDNWAISAYDAATTEYTHSGFYMVQKEDEGEWTLTDYTSTTANEHYAKNIKAASLYIKYGGMTLFPVGTGGGGGNGDAPQYAAVNLFPNLSFEDTRFDAYDAGLNLARCSYGVYDDQQAHSGDKYFFISCTTEDSGYRSIAYHNICTAPFGHQFYCQGWIKQDVYREDSPGFLQIAYSSGQAATEDIDKTRMPITAEGEWELVGGKIYIDPAKIMDSNINNEIWLRTAVGVDLSSTELATYADDILVVDLTETFGMGNEPSEEECKVMFADYDGFSRFVYPDTFRPQYYMGNATEIYNNTTISATIACQPGDLVVAAIATRDTLSVSEGWTLLSTSNVNSIDTNGHRLSWAYKFAESASESITVTQASAKRIYLNMVTISNATGVTDCGYSYRDELSDNITLSKPAGPTLWAVTTPLYRKAPLPYPIWDTSYDMPLIQLGENTQSRLVVGLDHSDASSVNFYIPAEIYATETSLIAGALTIHGIDKFY